MRIKRERDEYKGDRQLALDSRLAIGYARGSTDDQVNSCPRQRELFLRTAAQRGVQLIGIIEDPGTSGEKTKVLQRPAFLDLLARCLAEGCFHIWVEDVKRFSRFALDRHVACDFLWRQHGISVYFLHNNLVSSRPQDAMVLALLSQIAEDDNRSRREYCERTRDLLRRENKRVGKQPPFGWEEDPFCTYSARGGKTKHHWRPCGAEQEILALMFDMVQLGMSTVRIARQLNALGLKPKGAPRYMRRSERNVCPQITGAISTDSNNLCESVKSVENPSRGIWYPSTVQSVLEHARHQDGRTCVVDKQGGRLTFTITRAEVEQSAAAVAA